MITTKRGEVYFVDGVMGGRRLRGSLGTKDKAVASRLKSRVELAMAEGSRSENWVELRRVLPASTYARAAKLTGLRVEELPTWGGLLSIFWKDSRLAANTVRRYGITIGRLSAFLELEHSGPDTSLSDITPWVINQFWDVRREAVAESSLALEAAILHGVFKKGEERGQVHRNPVRLTKSPESKVTPFTGEELSRLRGACETDLEKLVFAVLRYTGLRVSDVADLRWDQVHFLDRVVRRECIKNGREIEIPMAEELYETLRTGYDILGRDNNVIILKNKSVSTQQIRQILRLINYRAKVENVHPHRFRHTYAVDMLMKGCTPFEVAQMLGDTTATVEKHYLSFVEPLQAKVKRMMDDNSKGLEAKGE